MTARFRHIATPLLAILGVEGWLTVLHGDWGGRGIYFKILVASLAVALIGPLRRAVWSILRRARRPSPAIRAATAAAVTIVAVIALWRGAITSHRDLFPTMHDEFQFLLQARMAAAGRLWMAAHPLLDFFDTFYVLIQPKYAAQSFPGTALLYVPAIWMHIAAWKWSVLLAGLTVGLFYRVTAELIDGLAGLLAAALLADLSLFRYVSTMVLAQTPVMLLGLASIWAYLHWRRRKSVGWAGMIGLFAGWMALTRPADALIFAIPIAIGMLKDFPASSPGRIVWTLAAMALAACPFLVLQLLFNVGVTGQWFRTPFALYNQRDQPGLAYALYAPVNPARPATRVPEKRRYYQSSVVPRFADQRPDRWWHSFMSERLPVTVGFDLAQPMLAALLPMGVLAWGRRRAWLLASGLPLFFLIYLPYPLFASHYPIVAAPAVILAALLGVKAVALAWRGAGAGAWTAVSLFVAGVLCAGAVDIAPMQGAKGYHSVVLKAANDQIAALEAKGRPAVVLFRRDRELSPEVEPVYNLDSLWPDEAIVIRAHDRGRFNAAIFKYYASHGPPRAFYRFDESRPTAGLRFLGMSSDLAKTSGGH